MLIRTAAIGEAYPKGKGPLGYLRQDKVSGSRRSLWCGCALQLYVKRVLILTLEVNEMVL
jgi:hypothetical protein